MARRKKKPDDPVVISRVHEFLVGHDRRFYAYSGSEDPKRASIFTREEAEKLLARGRWHGLDPKIEDAPKPEESEAE